MDQHEAVVKRIATQARSIYTRKEAFRISHGSSNSTRNLHGDENSIDISPLNRVLHINKGKKTALVEPNVPMDRLVEATLRHGLVPLVVMEFPGITAGGGYAGTSGESSSFKYGFFDRTLNFAEVVLADGQVIRISNEDHADLFCGAAGALGTLGITTLVEIRLREAKKYVRVEYHPVKGMDQAVDVTKRVTADSQYDYVDGIMFSKDSGTILAGSLTDEQLAGDTIQRFSRPWDPWYYLHVRERLEAHEEQESKLVTDLVPLAEYLFRYDRGGFWVGQSAFEYVHFPFNRLTRWLVDDFMHTRMLYRALHASSQSMPYVVQDLALPYESASAFVDYTDEVFGIYPLWLCPLKQSSLPTFHPHTKEGGESDRQKPLLNIGLWGWPPKSGRDMAEVNHELEARLRALGGMKWFYAQCYYTEAEFWNIYDRPWYDSLRKRYKAQHLPSVWHKVCGDTTKAMRAGESWKIKILKIWPLAGLWGLWKAMASFDWWRRVKVQRLEVTKTHMD